jgi:hypothetical protein
MDDGQWTAPAAQEERWLYVVCGMLSIEPKTKAERREAKHKTKMAVSGRNMKRLAQHIANRPKIDLKRAS